MEIRIGWIAIGLWLVGVFFLYNFFSQIWLSMSLTSERAIFNLPLSYFYFPHIGLTFTVLGFALTFAEWLDAIKESQ